MTTATMGEHVDYALEILKQLQEPFCQLGSLVMDVTEEAESNKETEGDDTLDPKAQLIELAEDILERVRHAASVGLSGDSTKTHEVIALLTPLAELLH
jgi:hypothetical protein